MDVQENISNIRKRLGDLDNEAKRLAGMLEVFETMKNMGVKIVTPQTDDKLNITNTEEVVDVLGETN